MRKSVILSTLPVHLAVASVALSFSCAGRGSGTGQPYYGPGTGPVGSFIKAGSLGSGGRPEFLYWVNESSSDIAIFAIDSQTGCLAPVHAHLSTGQGPISVMAHPDPTKKLLYVGCTSGQILPYFIDPQGSGNLRATPTSANVSTIGRFVAMKFRPDGKFLYVLTNDANARNAPTLTTFAVDFTTGGLAPPQNPPGKPLQTSLQIVPPAPGLKAVAMTIDPTSGYAYVALADARIVVLKLDSTGDLQIVQQTQANKAWAQGAPEPSCLLAHSTFLYEGSRISSDLDFFRSQTGQLGVASTTFATGGQVPVALAVPFTGNFLFSANNQSGDISQFTLDATNGVLGPNPLPPPLSPGSISQGQPANAKNLTALAIGGTASTLYSLDNGGGQNPSVVAAFTIAKNGTLSPATPSGATTKAGAAFASSQQGAPGGSTPNPDAITVAFTN